MYLHICHVLTQKAPLAVSKQPQCKASSFFIILALACSLDVALGVATAHELLELRSFSLCVSAQMLTQRRA